jgi:hypothetical protein
VLFARLSLLNSEDITMEGLAVLLFIFFAVVVGLAVTVGYLRTVLSYDEAEASKPPMGEASNLIEKVRRVLLGRCLLSALLGEPRGNDY